MNTVNTGRDWLPFSAAWPFNQLFSVVAYIWPEVSGLSEAAARLLSSKGDVLRW